MEYVYTALLLHSVGQQINEKNVKKVLEATGVKPDDAKVKALIAALEGVNIGEILKQAALPVAAPVAAEAKPEEKKEEEEKKKEEKEAESAAEGLGALFG